MKLRQYEKSELTKERILEAAVDEFAEKGFYGARVDAIAEASGINKRMLYAHFESKEKLYAKVLLIAYEWIAARERECMVEDEDPIDAIKGFVNMTFDFLLENPKFIRLLMWENLNRAVSIPKDELVKLKEPTFEYIRQKIRLGKKLGTVRESVDEHQIVLSVMSFAFAYFSNAHTMSALMDRNLTSRENVLRRSEFISDMIVKYLEA